jgi:hypothetical protein
LIYGLEKVGVFNSAYHYQVNRPLKQFLQRFQKAKLRVSVLSLFQLLKFHQKIKVAGFCVETCIGHGRAE